MPNLSWFNGDKEKLREWYRKYRASRREHFRIYNKKYNKVWRKENGYHNEANSKKRYPEKERARAVLQYAVRKGKVIRGCCLVCGKKKTQAHHTDYTKPLNVKWLCSRHHAETHRSYPQLPLAQ